MRDKKLEKTRGKQKERAGKRERNGKNEITMTGTKFLLWEMEWSRTGRRLNEEQSMRLCVSL